MGTCIRVSSLLLLVAYLFYFHPAQRHASVDIVYVEEEFEVLTTSQPTTEVVGTSSSPSPTLSPVPVVEKVINKVVKPFIPTRIEIAKAGVDADIVKVKLVNNQIQAPSDYDTVGWFSDSGLVGENKTVIMDGHYDSKTGKAVFYELQTLKINDIVTVYSKESKLHYKVVHMASYNRFKAPLDKIYKNDGMKRLNLITCGGTFDKKLGSYNRRLVVYCLIV
jgi:LPXTG-site transpeptidase (sortase) family protein